MANPSFVVQIPDLNNIIMDDVYAVLEFLIDKCRTWATPIT